MVSVEMEMSIEDCQVLYQAVCDALSAGLVLLLGLKNNRKNLGK